MNIQSLGEIINQFQELIVGSGFKRDINDFASSLNNNQNNIVALREIATKIHSYLEEINDSDLAENLTRLFPKTPKPFTEGNHYQSMAELLLDNEIPQDQFFQKLQQIINQLKKQLQQNESKVEEIKNFIQPYINQSNEIQKSEDKTIVSVIFKEEQTISNLKTFTKTIATWNRILPVYHQILKSSSPSDIEIIEIQNGSVDFLFNFDFDIALNLTELFNKGFEYFLAYLSYKKISKPISQTFFGNKELEEKQQDIENRMLDNIETAIAQKITEQYETAKENDDMLPTNASKMIIEVAKLVSSHIINGNDLKLLSTPLANEEESDEESDESKTDLKNEIKEVSSKVRKALKQLPKEEIRKLIERYGDLPEEDENKK
ncbi:MAG: Uncharacterised protein [Bacteroidota bacterium]|nr:MAG: Uncharacterised protein [Bacteroidota bacterium]